MIKRRIVAPGGNCRIFGGFGSPPEPLRGAGCRRFATAGPASGRPAGRPGGTRILSPRRCRRTSANHARRTATALGLVGIADLERTPATHEAGRRLRPTFKTITTRDRRALTPFSWDRSRHCMAPTKAMIRSRSPTRAGNHRHEPAPATNPSGRRRLPGSPRSAKRRLLPEAASRRR